MCPKLESKVTAFLQIGKFAGIVFMAVCTILFYRDLLVAYGNKGFFTWIYFDAFSEGLVELVLFILVIPFILLALVFEGLNMYQTIKLHRKLLKIETIK